MMRMLGTEQPNNLAVLGSGDLVQTLMRHNLVDQYVLLIHPLVLGSGASPFRKRRCIRISSANRHEDVDHRRGDRNLPVCCQQVSK
jgi:riboflavin biosynthesis pyrimidine reductase